MRRTLIAATATLALLSGAALAQTTAPTTGTTSGTTGSTSTMSNTVTPGSTATTGSPSLPVAGWTVGAGGVVIRRNDKHVEIERSLSEASLN